MSAKFFKRIGILSLVLLLWASLWFLLPHHVFANELNDEFPGTVINSAIWTGYPNSGVISFSSSVLSLRQGNPRRFPFVISNNFTLDSGEFIEIKYRLFDPIFGTGIVFYDSPIPNGTSSLLSKTLIEIWPAAGGKIGVAIAALCDISEQSCDRQYKYLKLYTPDQEWHYARLEKIDNIYKFILDSEILLVSKPTTKTVGALWFGNPEITNTDVVFTKLDVDYVRTGAVVTPTPTPTVIPTPTPSPTPSPTPEPLRPVIIIPGMFASADFGPLLRGQGNNWHIPQFITLYSNLVSSLENAGYEEGTNLFVFAYDWRKRLNALGTELNDYVDSLVAADKISPTSKINLIGHSYGGLVARTYAQANAGKVNKLVMAGSPNKGSVDAYGTWEGAEAWGKWWAKILLWASVQRLKYSGENDVNAVRRISPSIQDVLPTFDFLEQNGVFKSTSSMFQKNSFLPNLDGSIETIDNLTSIIRGTGEWTTESVKVQDRSPEDSLLNKWEDGKPIVDDHFVKTEQGDGAVLLPSAAGLFSSTFTIDGDHGAMIAGRPALEKIFEELGLDPTKVITTGALDTRESALLIGLKSPGTLNVCDPQNICNESLGIYYPEGEKLFIYPGYTDQDLSISVAASGETGDYTLETGFVSEQKQQWKETPGRLDSPTEVDSYPLKDLWDTTPPAIIPHLSSEPNSAGWNNSDVTVNWEVSDPDSEITSTDNCGPVVISTETSGREITCSVTSYGGTTSRSVIIKLDKTKPVIAGSFSSLPNNYGWNNTDVGVSFVCGEVGIVQSGLAENTVSGGALITEGQNQSLANSGNCVDNAGNAALSVDVSGINIDKTGPVVVINSPTGTTYAINAIINSGWSVSDALSGLDGTEEGTVPPGSPIDTNSFGIKSFVVTATDRAGNRTTKEVLYSVGYTIINFLKPVSIDGKIFKGGSTVPIKFQLKDAFGRLVPFVDARLLVNGQPAIGSGASNNNNNFRYDFFDQQYIFNLSTKMFSLVSSPYELEVTLNGVPSYSSMIAVR